MKAIEYRTIDKANWPAGVWHNEPDKRQWIDEATGLPCLIVRHRYSGHLCGYVGVSPEHPLHGKSYDHRVKADVGEIAIHGEAPAFLPILCNAWGEQDGTVSLDALFTVHGGLTFAGGSHHGDDPSVGVCHQPGEGEPDNVWWFGFDCAHSGDLTEVYSGQRRGVYRTVEYVASECAELAKQLAGFNTAS